MLSNITGRVEFPLATYGLGVPSIIAKADSNTGLEELDGWNIEIVIEFERIFRGKIASKISGSFALLSAS